MKSVIWLLIAILILLLGSVAISGRLLYRSEYVLSDLRSRIESERIDAESYAAWYHATRWETLQQPLDDSGKLPVDAMRSDRKAWVQAYERGVAKPNGVSKRYRNSSYTVTALLRIVDMAPQEMLRRIAAIRDKKKSEQLWAGARLDHYLKIRCTVDKLDEPGEWFSHDYSFTEVTENPTRELFDKIKTSQ